jgi:hypothetical protein
VSTLAPLYQRDVEARNFARWIEPVIGRIQQAREPRARGAIAPDAGDFSLVRGDWPFRIQRALG